MFRRQRCGGGIGHGKALVRSAADVTDLVGRCGRVQRQFSGAAPRVMVRDRGNRMINRKMGQAGRAASPPLIALALLWAGVVPAFSQETTTSRPLDFRLPPAEDDNRTPGVRGPSDNGLPPVAPGERRGQPTPAPTPAQTPVQPATPPRVIPTQPATVTTPAPTATQRDTPATPRPVPSVPAPSAPSDATDNPTLPPLEATTPATPTAPGTTSERPIAADKAPVAAGPTSPSSGTPLWAWLLAL